MTHQFVPSTLLKIEHASRQPLDVDHPDRTSGLAWRLAEISRESAQMLKGAGSSSTAPGNGGGPR